MTAQAFEALSLPLPHPLVQRVDSEAQRCDVAYLGRTVCWRRWGDKRNGSALVLIHGGHGNWMHWVRNIEALAASHAVWVPDLPGFGDSEELAAEPHAPNRQELMLDAVAATLGTLVSRDEPLDIAGFSFGGLVAAELAARLVADDRNVRRVALLGPAGHGTARRQKLEMVNWRTPDRAHMLAGLRHNLAAFMLHAPAAIDELAMSVHELSCRKTRFRSKAISRDAGRLQAAIDRFDAPLLLIWGEHDVTAVPHEVAPKLAEAHGHREWCVVPGAGHWVQFEAADDVNQLLGAWFAPGQGTVQ